MPKSILKWLAALLTGAASAGLAYLSGHTGSGPAVDPFIAAIVVGLVTKAAAYLTSKLPAA